MLTSYMLMKRKYAMGKTHHVRMPNISTIKMVLYNATYKISHMSKVLVSKGTTPTTTIASLQ